MESRCQDKVNIREFLDGLQVRKEELATYGVDIEEKYYWSTIIKLFPPHLSAFASNLLAGARLYSSSKTINPDELITLVSEEYERHVSQRSRRPGQAGGKTNDKDEALTMSGNGKGRSFDCKPKGTCWNCGDKGHYRNKCPKPAHAHSNKKTDSPKSGGSANAAVKSDNEVEVGFFAELDDEDKMPALLSNYKTDTDEEENGTDWFSEMGEDTASVIEDLSQSDVDGSEPDSHVSIGNENFNESEDAHTIQDLDNTKPENTTHIEVYDSGCTRHITPYRQAVMNFKEISPKSFQAANRQSFSAVGKGEMVIHIPNGTTTSQIKLTEVLYSPEVGYTLVSIGRLDEAGFVVTFANGKCVIRG
jgi:Pol polyprotein, beta-barrel domain